jgi:hypothetical protein
MTVLALVRLSPIPPALVEIRKMNLEGFLLNSSTIGCLLVDATLPSRREYSYLVR